MKKIFITLLMAVMVLPTMVSAQEATYYTNANGVTLTEEQYNYLTGYFSENTLYSMTKEQLNLIKDDRNLTITTETKYIRTDEVYDNMGNLLESVETEVSEEDALNYDEQEQITPYAWNVTYQTTMKRLYMQVVSSSASTKIVTITNTWLSLPKVRSFDVIALRPEANSMTINVNSNTISGYQNWDGNVINYNGSSSNTKKSSSFTGNGGIGISMNIVDNVSSSLETSMTVYFLCGNSTFSIAGTYQHATSDVTLAQSQNYSFSSSGNGNVLSFASSVASKYDDMQGVKLTYNHGDELYG